MRRRTRFILASAVLVAAAAAGLTARHDLSSTTPESFGATLRGLVDHTTVSLMLVESNGQRFVKATAPMRPMWTLPSGPPEYVFGTDGRLVDWTADSGDDSEFVSRWAAPGSMISIEDAVLPVSRALARQVREHHSVDFRSITEFEWDRVFIFTPYSTQSEVELVLGYRWDEWSRTSIEVDEDVCLVMFVHQDQVVHWFEHPRTIDLCGVATQEGYAPDEATFIVVADPTTGALRLSRPQ